MSKKRVEGEIGYILHTWPYRETSVIVECFTQNYGRVSLVAKGAKRPYSLFRGILQTFRPLRFNWGGTSELKTLHQVEITGPYQMPVGLSWLCGCYLNELVLKLLGRQDPHPVLFDQYHQIVSELSQCVSIASTDQVVYEVLLRRFEKAMLKEIGYEVNFTTDRFYNPVNPKQRYHIEMGRGTIELAPELGDRPGFSGKALIDLHNDEYQSAETRLAAKRLMRQLINHQLGGDELRTRRLLVDLQSF